MVLSSQKSLMFGGVSIESSVLLKCCSSGSICVEDELLQTLCFRDEFARLFLFFLTFDEVKSFLHFHFL